MPTLLTTATRHPSHSFTRVGAWNGNRDRVVVPLFFKISLILTSIHLLSSFLSSPHVDSLRLPTTRNDVWRWAAQPDFRAGLLSYLSSLILAVDLTRCQMLGQCRRLAHLSNAMLCSSKERSCCHQRHVTHKHSRSGEGHICCLIALFNIRPPLQNRRHVDLQDRKAWTRQGPPCRHWCMFW